MAKLKRDDNDQTLRPGEDAVFDVLKQYGTVPAGGGASTSASADNAAATATKGAPGAGKNLLVFAVDASFGNSTASALLQVKDGTTVIWEVLHIGVHKRYDFSPPLKITANVAAAGVLGASGTGGIIGRVNLLTHTV